MASGRDFQGLAVPWSPASIPSLGGTGQSSLKESGDKYRGWIFFKIIYLLLNRSLMHMVKNTNSTRE